MIPKQADVVVIGGGVLGASAAFHLADRGCGKIVVLDRGPLASGTTPFAAGQTGYLNCDRFALEFGLYCIEFFENFEQRTGRPIDFRQSGSLRVALTDSFQADLESRRAAAKELGHDVDFISAEQARELAPNFSPPDGCLILRIPRDGYVEPKSVAVAFASAAVDRGVEVFTGVNAIDVIQRDGRARGVRTTVGEIECGWVVLAAGAWVRQFGQRLGMSLAAPPVRHQAYVTAPLDGVRVDQPVVRVTEPQVYVRQYDGGLLVGGYGYRPLSFDMNEFPDDFEIPALAGDPVYYRQLADAAAKYFPALRDAVVIQERRGLPTVSPDGKMLVSESKHLAGLIVMSGCGVGGIDRSPGAGRLVADLVSGDPPWISPEVLAADRFDGHFTHDAALRARCEEVYAHHYHDVY